MDCKHGYGEKLRSVGEECPRCVREERDSLKEELRLTREKVKDVTELLWKTKTWLEAAYQATSGELANHVWKQMKEVRKFFGEETE